MSGYANRIIAMSDKLMRKKKISRYRKRERKEKIHEKSAALGSVSSTIEELTGLALPLSPLKRRELFVSTRYGQTCRSVLNERFIILAARI